MQSFGQQHQITVIIAVDQLIQICRIFHTHDLIPMIRIRECIIELFLFLKRQDHIRSGLMREPQQHPVLVASDLKPLQVTG